MKEIITLHFGEYSNFVGSFYWRAQAEMFASDLDGSSHYSGIDHTTLFRAISSSGGSERFVPRAMFFDLNGSLGIHRALNGQEDGNPYETDQATFSASRYLDADEEMPSSFGNGGYGTAQASPLLPSKSAATKSWGDSLYTLIDKNSVVPLGGRSNFGDDLGCSVSPGDFEVFSQGEYFFSELMEDNIRSLLEECDGVQGFQLIYDADSGFGSLCSSSLRFLNDECPRVGSMTYGIIQPSTSVVSSSPTAYGDDSTSDLRQLYRGDGNNSSDSGTHSESSIFRTRKRASIRALNLGLGYSTFATDFAGVETHFVPLSVGSSSTNYIGSLCHMRQRNFLANFSNAAFVIDSLSLAYRRDHSTFELNGNVTSSSIGNAYSSSGYDNRTGDFSTLVGPSSTDKDANSTLGIDSNAKINSGNDFSRKTFTNDSNKNGVSSTEPDESSLAALSDMAVTTSMNDFLSTIQPAPALRVSAVSVAAIRSVFTSTAASFNAFTSKSSPLHATPLFRENDFATRTSGSTYDVPDPTKELVFQKLSLLNAEKSSHIDDHYGQVGARRLQERERVNFDMKNRCVPFAHVATLRNVVPPGVPDSLHAVSGSSKGYSLVFDSLLSRTPCVNTGSIVLRGCYPDPGVFAARRGVPMNGIISKNVGSSQGDQDLYSHLVYHSNSQSYAPTLRTAYSLLNKRDRQVLHRFLSSERNKGITDDDFREGEAALATLYDTYSSD